MFKLFVAALLVAFASCAEAFGTWTQCATDGGTCTFPSSTDQRTVSYGPGTVGPGRPNKTKRFTGSAACNAGVFGTVPGTAKKCWYSSVNTGTGGGGSTGGIPTIASIAGKPVVGRIDAVSNQIIENLHIVNATGPCIVVASGVTNVTIRNNEIGPCGASSWQVGDVGVYMRGTNSTITRNVLHDASSMILVEDSQNGHQITKNLFYRPMGPRWAGQHIQTLRTNGGTSPTNITCNVMDDTLGGQPRVSEDHINFGQDSRGISAGNPTVVSYNRIRGSLNGQSEGNGLNESGSGIQTADGSGLTGNLWVHHNIVTRVNGTGISISGGAAVLVEDNRVDNRGLSQSCTGSPVYCHGDNTGISFTIKNFSGTESCTGHVFNRNRGITNLWAYNHTGATYTEMYSDGLCGFALGTGGNANNFGDTSLNVSMFSEAQPAICQ